MAKQTNKQTSGKNFVHQNGMIEQHMMGHTKNELDHSYQASTNLVPLKHFI